MTTAPETGRFASNLSDGYEFPATGFARVDEMGDAYPQGDDAYEDLVTADSPTSAWTQQSTWSSPSELYLG